MNILQIRTHICTLLLNERIGQREVFSQRASEESVLARTHLNTSDWSSESCGIGYNAQCCKTRLSLAQHQPVNTDLNLAALNDLIMIALKIENINQVYFVFWKLHSKSSWLINLRGLVGHESSDLTADVSFMCSVLDLVKT